MSSKENCFKAALDSYDQAKKAAGQPTGWTSRWKQTWVQRTGTGNWEMSNRPWFTEVFSQLKTKLSRSNPSLPAGRTTQVRSPDLTLLVEGAQWVLDLKFSGDSFRNRPGAGNGNTQLEDYNTMNRQNNPGTDVDDPSLNPDNCNCRQRMKADVREYVSLPLSAYDQSMAYQQMMQGKIFILPLPLYWPAGALGGLLEGLGLGGRVAPEAVQGLAPVLGGAAP